MRHTKIAVAQPFVGAPKINLPFVYGASPKKQILLRVSATGERPMTFTAENLPEGLTLCGNILSGKVAEEGNYKIVLVAKNALGEDRKEVTLEIVPGRVLLTPLMGFTTWNAFASRVRQENVVEIAQRVSDLGIAEYGYGYINLDSGWQWKYGGEFDAIMPNEKFPDMKAMTDAVHALGFKCGIYSTPMLTAWGCPEEFASIPGCTVGEPDARFSETMGGIGVIHKEANNVRQWDAWGFDYLKYDWRPTDPVNAELMRVELMKASRDFGYCVTVKALIDYHRYWSMHVNSYRCNVDSQGYWDNLVEIYRTYFPFIPHINKGHFFDLDMLDVGTCGLQPSRLTEDEAIVAYTMRAFFNSPIQISSTLENIGEFEFSLYCHEEMIAINQDSAFSTAHPVMIEEKDGYIYHVFEKKLEDGKYAYALFNLGEKSMHTQTFFEGKGVIRDVWAKENLTEDGDYLFFRMHPHTVRVLKSDTRLYLTVNNIELTVI